MHTWVGEAARLPGSGVYRGDEEERRRKNKREERQREMRKRQRQEREAEAAPLAEPSGLALNAPKESLQKDKAKQKSRSSPSRDAA